jgi:cyclophilin family peptidyl-prolyl cis-trans isomerase
VLARLAEIYPEDVQIVYRHFPLTSIHDKALLAGQAAEAAGRQDAFWPMHDLLFSRQSEWAALSVAEFGPWLERQAVTLKLDAKQFAQDLKDATVAKEMQQAWELNSTFMPGTPYIMINGEPYEGRLSLEDLKTTVALTLLARRQYQDCPPFAIDPTRQYLAEVETVKGSFTLELYADKAPLAVNNFIFLAREGWYDGVTFHRVLPNFVVQAGDPTGTGYGGPGYAFDNEANDLSFAGAGWVGMANAGPGSNGSQFFVTMTATPHLDGGYTIFARVIDGLDVLSKLTPRDPERDSTQPPGDAIISVTIIEK